MSGDLVLRMLLGHLVGDYLLQTNWMALNKKKHFGVALLHCLVWTAAVTVAIHPELAGLSLPRAVIACMAILASHLVLDATDIVDRWLDLIGSRSYRRAREYCELPHAELAHPDLYKQFMISYTAVVQTVADNTLHLVFLYLILKFLIVTTG